MLLRIDEVALENLVNNPKGDVAKFLRKKSIILQTLAKKQVGAQSGALRRSISYRLSRNGRGLVAYIGANNRVALMHHEGTRPHIIRPKRAQTLRFYSHGRIVYSKLVHHPGTKPNRYLTDNMQRLRLR